jgi:hypothetical protein
MPGSHELMFTNLIGLADKIIEAARDWRLEGWRHPESKPTTARHWSPAPPRQPDTGTTRPREMNG